MCEVSWRVFRRHLRWCPPHRLGFAAAAEGASRAPKGSRPEAISLEDEARTREVHLHGADIVEEGLTSQLSHGINRVASSLHGPKVDPGVTTRGGTLGGGLKGVAVKVTGGDSFLINTAAAYEWGVDRRKPLSWKSRCCGSSGHGRGYRRSPRYITVSRTLSDCDATRM